MGNLGGVGCGVDRLDGDALGRLPGQLLDRSAPQLGFGELSPVGRKARKGVGVVSVGVSAAHWLIVGKLFKAESVFPDVP